MAVGINKKLYERRMELDYSVTEACIRLDIRKRHLYLIENGYIDVDEKLQQKFIRKYKLDPDFFNNDENLGYPTPLDAVEAPTSPKVIKILSSLWIKIISLAFAVGLIIMGSYGLYYSPRIQELTPTHFNNDINNLDSYAKSSGVHYNYIFSIMATLRLDDYYAIENEDTVKDETGSSYNFYSAANFFEKKENISYTFTSSRGLLFTKELVYLPFEVGNLFYETETKYEEQYSRTHLYLYESNDSLMLNCLYHLSVDKSIDGKNYEFNLVECFDDYGSYTLNEHDFEYHICTSLFYEADCLTEAGLDNLFNKKISETGVKYASFKEGMFLGNKDNDGFMKTMGRFLVYGFVCGFICLAIFILSLITTYSLDDKLLIPVSEDVDFSSTGDGKVKEVKQIKRNWKIVPFIPECVVRVAILLVLLVSSLALYRLFQSLTAVDIEATFNNLSLKKETAAFSSLAIILAFFIKLDNRAKQKNTFLSNFILFFVGLIYYIIMIAIAQNLGSNTGLFENITGAMLLILPGNIVWSILAFNLLVGALFSTPLFKEPTKKKYILYRLTALIPISYMAASVIIQIGTNTCGWVIPFEITSLFFTKAISITGFAILYCFAIYFYRKFVYKKYGKENAEIYQNGRRYIFIKNLIVASIVAVIGIVDIVIFKVWPDNPLKCGGNYILLIGIPLMLFYHPHMGKRNGTWDLVFTILYVLCLLLGVLLIAGSMSNYLASI